MSVPEAPPDAPDFAPPAPPPGPPGPPGVPSVSTRAASVPAESVQDQRERRDKEKQDYMDTELRGMTLEQVLERQAELQNKKEPYEGAINKLKRQLARIPDESQNNIKLIAKAKKNKEVAQTKLARLSQSRANAAQKQKLRASYEKTIENSQKTITELETRQAALPTIKIDLETELRQKEKEQETLASYINACQAKRIALKPKGVKVEDSEQKRVGEKGFRASAAGIEATGPIRPLEYARLENYCYFADGTYDKDGSILELLKIAYCSEPDELKKGTDASDVTAEELQGYLNKIVLAKMKGDKTSEAFIRDQIEFDPVIARKNREQASGEKADQLSKPEHYQHDQYGRASAEPLKKLQSFFSEDLGYKIAKFPDFLRAGIEAGRITPSMINAVIGFDIEQSIKNKEALKKIAEENENKEVLGAKKIENYLYDLEGNATEVPLQKLRDYFRKHSEALHLNDNEKSQLDENGFGDVLKVALEEGRISIATIDGVIGFSIKASMANKKALDAAARKAALEEEQRLAAEKAAKLQEERATLMDSAPETPAEKDALIALLRERVMKLEEQPKQQQSRQDSPLILTQHLARRGVKDKNDDITKFIEAFKLKNESYLRLYAQGQEKRHGGFFGFRVNTKQKFKHAQARQGDLQKLLDEYNKNRIPPEIVKTMLENLIKRDMKLDEKDRGYTRKDEGKPYGISVHEMLSEAQANLQEIPRQAKIERSSLNP